MATVGNILTRFQLLSQDDYTRWTKAELVEWINEAYSRIVSLKPQATATRATVSLASGPYQSLDDVTGVNLPTAYSLIRIERNAGGSTVRFIDMKELDYNVPDWPSAAPVSVIERWSFNPESPREFIVYPPASAGAQVEVLYAAAPGTHNAATAGVENESLKIAESYAPIILDYVAYRAYQKDADDPENANRAAGFLNTFMAGLGQKADS